MYAPWKYLVWKISHTHIKIREICLQNISHHHMKLACLRTDNLKNQSYHMSKSLREPFILELLINSIQYNLLCMYLLD